MESRSGYSQDRFKGTLMNQFDCPICMEVVKSPYECQGCGQLYCQWCIQDWQKKQNQCPNRCDAKHKIVKMGVALSRIYKSLDISCTHCKKYKKLGDIEAHEIKCSTPKCLLYKICGNNVSEQYKKLNVCDPSCLLLQQWEKHQKNPKQMLKIIKEHLNKYQGPQQAKNSGPWTWDKNRRGDRVEITQNNNKVWLKEQAYMFRTVIGTIGFTSGIHYWEIHAHDETENELKIGVCSNPNMNLNTAFCDFDYGWAYYGLGQLRHGSNASGKQFGKRFRKKGILGIFLNMNKGTLSFALNGEFMGVAFTDPVLKRGPIYPAVSLLHCAGCTVDTSKPPPQYML